jgi:hypothetical protein
MWEKKTRKTGKYKRKLENKKEKNIDKRRRKEKKKAKGSMRSILAWVYLGGCSRRTPRVHDEHS